MSTPSLQEALQRYDDPIAAMRAAEIVTSPTPNARPRPREYTNWIEEQMSWKETCYIGDWSFMPDLHTTGPEALDLWRDLTVNTVEDFPIGKAKHAVHCNEQGKVIGDGILYRAGEEEYRSQHLAAWPMFHAERGEYDVECQIHDTFIFQVQGPTSLALLESLTETDMVDVPFMYVEPTEIDGIKVMALRQGMSGEVGFELQGDLADKDAVWETIVEAGQEFGLRQLGTRTHIINHLEMAFSTRGHHYLPAIFDDTPIMREYREWLDADNAAEAKFTISGSYQADDVSEYYRSPVDLNWGRNIAFDHEFIGRAALESDLENPSKRTVTLVWEANDVVDVFASYFREGTPHKWMEMPYQNYRAIEGDAVLADDQVVGMSTGRGYSYYFREMISLCAIDIEYAEPGTEVTVIWGEGGKPSNPRINDHEPKEISARVAPAPYKEDKRRTDLGALTSD